ncbi:hypothetical protein [Devosia sp.]|uniref:hypothetical protein n=1 Tax=Devosia sp. TaxID=1871048 RepID=UPI002FC7328E
MAFYYLAEGRWLIIMAEEIWSGIDGRQRQSFRVDWAAEPSVWFASINLPHVVRCVFEYVGLTRLIAGRLRLPLASASLRLGSGLPAVSAGSRGGR